MKSYQKIMNGLGIAVSRVHVALLLSLIVATTLVSSRKIRHNGHPQSRSVRVMNQAGFPIDIFWVHPETNELAPSNTDGEGIMYGSETGINSYVGHEFEIQEMPNKRTGRCRGPVSDDGTVECRKAYFAVNYNDDQLVTVGRNLENITISDNKSRAMEKAKTALSDCNMTDYITSDLKPSDRLKQLTDCLERQIQLAINQTDNEIQFQAAVRKDMGNKLKSYVCNPNNGSVPVTLNITTTTVVRNATWTYQPNNKKKPQVTLPMKYLFESDNSNIRLIKDFITTEECNSIIKATVEAKADSASQSVASSVSPSGGGGGSGTYEITSNILVKNPIVDEFVTKVNMLMKAVIGLHENYYKSSKDDPLLEVFVRTASTSRNSAGDTKQQQKDCELSTDGTCVQSSSTGSFSTNTEDVNSSNGIRISDITEHTEANIIIFCKAPPKQQTDTVTNTTGNSPIKTMDSTKSGMVYFPKAGVRVLPTENVGDALLVVHYNPVTKKRDEDPFVDEYIICPVFSSSSGSSSSSNSNITPEEDNEEFTVVTIEDSF